MFCEAKPATPRAVNQAKRADAPFLQFGGVPSEGTPIAIVRGGEHDGKMVFLIGDTPRKPPTTAEKKQLKKAIDECGGDWATIYELRGAVKDGNMKIISEFVDALRGVMERRRSVEIEDGEFEVIPRTASRECNYIAAPSGSGKSYWVGKYARQYNRLFPNNKVVLFSKVEGDVSLKGVRNVAPVALDQSIVDTPIDATELADALVIFDDTDTIKDKKIKKAINDLKGDLLETGRHNNTYVCITSHLICNYAETRQVLNESHGITIYPQSGSIQQIERLLNVYFGMKKQDQADVLDLGSRWITLERHFPQHYISERKIALLGK